MVVERFTLQLQNLAFDAPSDKRSSSGVIRQNLLPSLRAVNRPFWLYFNLVPIGVTPVYYAHVMEDPKQQPERKTLDDRQKMSELERIRHSCAHVMATAIAKLWPD